jgi:hypothetical protein
MALQKLFRVATAIVLLSSASASADLKEILARYSALSHDLGIITGLIQGYKAIRISEATDFDRLAKKSDSMKTWVAITSYQDAIFVVRGLREKTLDSLNEFHDRSVANRVRSTIEPLVISEEDGSNPTNFWEACRGSVLQVLKTATGQLTGIRDELIKLLEGTGSDLAYFLRSVREQDPHFFSEMERAEVKELERSLQKLESIKSELSLEEQNFNDRKGKWMTAESHHRAALKQALDFEEGKLSLCRARHDALSMECLALETKLAQKKKEFETLYLDTFNREMERQRRERDQSLPKTDEKAMHGLEHLNANIRHDFQAIVFSVFDAAIAHVVTHTRRERSPGSYFKYVVEITSARIGFKSVKEPIGTERNPVVSLTVSLSTTGMKCPMSVSFKNKLDELPSDIRGFLNSQLAGLIQLGSRNYSSDLDMFSEAEEQTRRQCEAMSGATVQSAPLYGTASPLLSMPLPQTFFGNSNAPGYRSYETL